MKILVLCMFVAGIGTAQADTYLLLHARVSEGSEPPKSLVLTSSKSKSRVMVPDTWNSQSNSEKQISLRDTPVLAKLRARSYSVSAIAFASKAASSRQTRYADGRIAINPAPEIKIAAHTIHYFGDLVINDAKTGANISTDMESLRESCVKFPELMAKHPVVIQTFGQQPQQHANLCAEKFGLGTDEEQRHD